MSIDFTTEHGVARVTINRADRMNAIDAQAEVDLEKVWMAIEADRSLRCVVLTGAGDRAFCAGADMKSDSGKSGLAYWADGNRNGFGGLAFRQTLNIPVIARVQGVALGGGMEMVLGCDIVIASDNATFALPEARVGRLPLEGGMVLLQRLIPEKIAAGLMMTGRKLTATEAAHYGLVNSVVSAADLDTEVESWVSDIKACAPLSVVAIKHTIRSTAHMWPQQAQRHGSHELIAALNSEDSNEGVAAFREKRAPQWRGC